VAHILASMKRDVAHTLDKREAGRAESRQLGLCGLPPWHVGAGVLIKIELLFTVKRRRVAKAATLRYLALSGIARRFIACTVSPQSGR